MSFILGFSFVILLGLFTAFLWLVSKRLPKDFILLSVVILLAGDLVLTGLWYYGLLEIVQSEKHFRLGIAAAFCISAMGRSIYFLIQDNKNGINQHTSS